MITELSFDFLQAALNKWLSLDDNSSVRIKKLVGKIVKIEFSTTNFYFYLHFSDQKIYLLKQCETKPALVLKASLLTFIRSWSAEKKSSINMAKDIIIEGDAELAQQVNALFQELDIDWEAQLADVIGDIMAHQISEAGRSVKNWLTSVKTNFADNLTEYLQEEIHCLPTSKELNLFYSDVDILRNDVDRLEAKLKNLNNISGYEV